MTESERLIDEILDLWTANVVGTEKADAHKNRRLVLSLAYASAAEARAELRDRAAQLLGFEPRKESK